MARKGNHGLNRRRWAHAFTLHLARLNEEVQQEAARRRDRICDLFCRTGPDGYWVHSPECNHRHRS